MKVDISGAVRFQSTELPHPILKITNHTLTAKEIASKDLRIKDLLSVLFLNT